MSTLFSGWKPSPETSTKELRDKSSRRGIHEYRDGSINRDRDVRVRFCAGPVECATKPLSRPAGGKTVPCSLKIGANAQERPKPRLGRRIARRKPRFCRNFQS